MMKRILGLLAVLSILTPSARAVTVKLNAQLGGAQFENLASDPTSATGRVYYNTSTNLPKFYNGSSWRSLAPTDSPTFTGTVSGVNSTWSGTSDSGDTTTSARSTNAVYSAFSANNPNTGNAAAAGYRLQANSGGSLDTVGQLNSYGSTFSSSSYQIALATVLRARLGALHLVSDSGSTGVSIWTGSSAAKRFEVDNAGLITGTTPLTGTTEGSNVGMLLTSAASGRDVELSFGDTVNSSARIGYLAGDLYFRTNAATRMKLDTSGNLRIGNTAAIQSALLTVNGSVAARNSGVDGTFQNAFIASYSANADEHNVIQSSVSSVPTQSGWRFKVSDGGGASTSTTVLDLLKGGATLSTTLTVSQGVIQIQNNDASTGTVNALSTSGKAVIRFNASTTITLNGIADGSNGRRILIQNLTGNTLTVTNNSGSASAGNKIICPGGSNISVSDGGLIELYYDSSSSVWRALRAS